MSGVRKILHTELFLSSVYYSSNTWSKIDEKFAVADNKYSMSINLLTVKYNSFADMRTSHAQLLERGVQHGEEDSRNKILS